MAIREITEQQYDYALSVLPPALWLNNRFLIGEVADHRHCTILKKIVPVYTAYFAAFDAGHFISAGNGGFSLLFDERNVNGECRYDNAFNGNHLLLYRRGLDARYGKGTADALEERYRDCHFKGKTTKEWSKKEYEIKIAEIKEKLAAL
jgi:hypothetical protein